MCGRRQRTQCVTLIANKSRRSARDFRNDAAAVFRPTAPLPSTGDAAPPLLFANSPTLSSSVRIMFLNNSLVVVNSAKCVDSFKVSIFFSMKEATLYLTSPA